MDHKVSKDMISSGMIPSGEKTQADLGRTQYGSVPSPNKLMDAYKSMYDKKEEVINEHHQKDKDGYTIPHEDEELNEGKIPAGLQAYLDKKKGKKEDKKEMKEGMGLYANIHAKRKRGGKMRKKGDKGAPSSQDFANAAKTAKEEVDKFDVVFNHFINEGHSEKEAYAKMANLTEEQLDEFMKALATRAAQYGANLGKPASQKIDVINPKRKPFEPKRKPFDAKPKPGDSGFKAKSASDVVNAAAAIRRKKGEVMADEYQHQIDEIAFLAPALGKVAAIASKGAAMAGKLGKKVATKAVTAGAKKVNNSSLTSDMARGAAAQLGANMVSGGGGGQQKQRVDKVSAGSYQAASADLFDIVKGQLLDEGLSEEEIRDIMLTLTPDEILNEMGDYPAGKGANYRETPKVPEKKKLGGRTDGTAGSYVEKPKPTVDQMNARAKQEQNRQKFNDPSGVKNTNIGGRGKDLG